MINSARVSSFFSLSFGMLWRHLDSIDGMLATMCECRSPCSTSRVSPVTAVNALRRHWSAAASERVARTKRGSPRTRFKGGLRVVITGPQGFERKALRFSWWCYSTDWPLTTSPASSNLLILWIERLGPLYALLEAGVNKEPTP